MHRTEHWITQLKNTRLPANHLVFDTEAKIVKHGKVYEHSFACATSAHIRFFGGAFVCLPRIEHWHYAANFWSFVDDHVNNVGPLTLWAHNLAYDLRISDGLSHLIENGFELDSISLAPGATWASWHKGKTKLTMCDTTSWLPGPLEKIARNQNMVRPPLDYGRVSTEELADHCANDTRILARAVCEILNYLAAENLGNFRPTGSGQSHAALRRRFLPVRSIRVHTNTQALVAEREAMHTGRCEAWRHGPIPHTLYEFDLNLAYCRIAALNKVPGELAGERASLNLTELNLLEPDYCILAELDVETNEPVVPTLTENGTIWPIGKFTTCLWHPEITLLAGYAQDLIIRRAWLYRRTDALQSMCRWLLAKLDPEDQITSPIVKQMLKHWARTVVGRCGLRYRSWDYFGEHPVPGLCISYEPDVLTGEVNHNMRVGRQMLQLAALSESYSSVPAIPGFVASTCRTILWEMIQTAGPEHVYYMDTDGLLVDAAGARRLRHESLGRLGYRLDGKGALPGVTIHAPRNIEIGDERRLSGIPRRAATIGPLAFEGETWSGLEYALSTGRTDIVEVSRRTWQVTPVDNRRIHLPEGLTEPILLEVLE